MPSRPSDEEERDRSEERLASVFMRVELRDKATKRVLGSCAVRFWKGEEESALFDDGVDL